MAKINVTQKIKDYRGKNISSGENPKESLLLREVLLNALNYEDRSNDELKATPAEKVRAYDVSLQVMNNKTVDLKSEDIVFIKTRLAETYKPLVFGQAIKMLEGEVLPKSKK